jgi:hypothetical protein
VAPLPTPSANPSPEPEPGPDQPQIPPPPPDAAPRIVVDQPVHHFGRIWAGDDVRHAFVVRNEGTARLTVRDVKPECGCTQADHFEPQMAPGASQLLSFTLETDRLEDAFFKKISVVSDDPQQPVLQLALSGEIIPRLSVDPRDGALFGRLQRDQTETVSVLIDSNMDEPLSLTMPSLPPRTPFRAELIERQPGETFELRVTASPPYAAGVNHYRLELATNIEAQPGLTIDCLATVLPTVRAIPDEILLPVPLVRDYRRDLMVINDGETPMSILEVNSGHPLIRTAVTTRTRGQVYAIRVSIPAGFAPPPEGLELEVLTDHDGYPRLPVLIRNPQQATLKTPPAEIEPFVITPMKIADFGNVDGTATLARRVEIRPRPDESRPLELALIGPRKAGCFEIDVEPTPDGLGNAATITAAPPFQRGLNYHVFRFRTNWPDVTQIRLETRAVFR